MSLAKRASIMMMLAKRPASSASLGSASPFARLLGCPSGVDDGTRRGNPSFGSTKDHKTGPRDYTLVQHYHYDPSCFYYEVLLVLLLAAPVALVMAVFAAGYEGGRAAHAARPGDPGVCVVTSMLHWDYLGSFETP